MAKNIHVCPRKAVIHLLGLEMKICWPDRDRLHGRFMQFTVIRQLIKGYI